MSRLDKLNEALNFLKNNKEEAKKVLLDIDREVYNKKIKNLSKEENYNELNKVNYHIYKELLCSYYVVYGIRKVKVASKGGEDGVIFEQMLIGIYEFISQKEIVDDKIRKDVIKEIKRRHFN